MADFDLDAALSLRPHQPPARLPELVNLATGRAAGDPTPHTGEVFFYHEGAGDWMPVFEFQKCKVFVYCDAHHRGQTDADAFTSLLNNGKFPRGSGDFRCSSFQPYPPEGSREELHQWEQRGRAFIASLWPGSEPPAGDPSTGGPAPWSADIERTFPNGDSDTAKVLYLPVHGLAAYLHLYFRDAVSPHAICLPWADGGHERRLETWGRVLQLDHAAHESLLILPKHVAPTTVGTTDWHSTGRTFTDWQRTAYTAKPARLCHLL